METAKLTSARKVQNPFPFFAEAAEAAGQYLNAKREHLMLLAGIRAKRESKRAALGGAAAGVAHLAIFLSIFWLSFQIHEAGMPSWAIALVCLAVLGSLSAALALAAKRAGQDNSERGPHERR